MVKDKYTKEERWEIGRQLYYNEISRREAVEKYNVNVYTIRYYMRRYRDANKLPPKTPYAPISSRNGGRPTKVPRRKIETEQENCNIVSDNENK